MRIIRKMKKNSIWLTTALVLMLVLALAFPGMAEPESLKDSIMSDSPLLKLENVGNPEDGTLRWGDTGEQVLALQRSLQTKGYLQVTPDGIFGNLTEDALRRFQADSGLAVTGVADEASLQLLFSNVLYSGDRAPADGLESAQIGTDFDDSAETQDPFSIAPATATQTSAPSDSPAIAQGLVQPENFGEANSNGQTGDAAVSENQWSTNASYATLQYGDSGEDVRRMQEMLEQRGFLDVTPDGIYGWYSWLALQEFQFFNGLGITGMADTATLHLLYGNGENFTSLQIGMTGQAVLALQEQLVQLGYLEVTPDGGFGNYTYNAVVAFQRANGIYTDGIAGKYTIGKLLSSPVAKADSSYPQGADGTPDTDETSQTSSAAGLQYGGTYQIASVLGEQVLDVVGASVYDGTNVQLYQVNGSGAQKWVLQSADGGYFRLRNLRSWKCLDISGANVQQSSYDAYSRTQLWSLQKNADGTYTIVNANGMYLNVSAGYAGNGVNVDAAYGAGGAATQSWNLIPTTSDTGLDFTRDGAQYIGIRSFEIYQGNVTETSWYYNIETSIALPSGGYVLSGGDNYSIGLKVMYVNSYLASAGYLSWGYYNYNRYDGNTVWAVKQFQADHGLPADGIVGIYTWRAMGYSDEDFYNLGSYTTPLKVYAYGSDRSTYIAAMLNTAAEYAAAGTGFADGASGVPGTYVDCSGLIYQCLYAAGINPDTNIIDHARVVYEYTSAYLGADWRLGVSVGDVQPGDLIFYGRYSINHVAIYAGGGMIYDSWPGIGVSYRGMYSPGNILKIIRVF